MGSRLLSVPYKSQNDADANLKRSDCGPACVAMILAALGQAIATNQVTAACGLTGDQGVRIEQLIKAAKTFGLELLTRSSLTLDDLKTSIDNGQPPIALIKYGLIPDRWDQHYAGGHFVTVIGYDDAAQRVFINDPDYPPGAQGYQRAYAFDVFASAWGGFAAHENPNQCLIIPQLTRPISGITLDVAGTPAPTGPTMHGWIALPAGVALWSLPNVQAQLLFDLAYAQHVQQLSAGNGWLRVLTDSGFVGWIADRVNDLPTVSAAQPPSTYPIEVIDTQPVREAGGWSVRAERNLNAAPIDRIAVGEHAVIYSSRAEPDNTNWLWAQSPRGKLGWARESSGSLILVRKIDLQPNDDPSTPLPGLPPQPTPAPDPLNDVWVTAIDGLVLREKPDSTALRISGVPFGQKLIAVGSELPPDAAGRIWQSVRTEQGTAGFVLAAVGNERYLALTPPPKPYALEVSDTQFARDNKGLAVLQTHTDSAAVIDRLQIGERFTAYNNFADGNGTWLWIETPRNLVGWLRDKASGANLLKPIDPQPAPRPIVDPRPFGKCLTGLGMGNPQPLSPLELNLIDRSKIEAFKILTLPDPADMLQLIKSLQALPSMKFIVVRLFFPVDVDSKTHFSPQNFVETVFQSANAAYQAGVRYFEVHNEPNLENEGLNWNWRSGAEFGLWLSQVLAFLRARFPEMHLGFPGVSPQPNVPDFLTGAQTAIDQCDWIGAHAYWQSMEGGPYPLLATNAGMYWRTLRDRFPNKLIMITEFSNNNAGVDPAEKGRQYARYYQLLRTEAGLGAAFSFALNWPGQDANHEGWVYNNRETEIPGVVGNLIGQAGFLS